MNRQNSRQKNRYQLEYKWGKAQIKGTVTIQKSPSGTEEAHHLRVGAKTIGYYKRSDANPKGETSLSEDPLESIGKGNLLSGVLLSFAMEGLKDEKNQSIEYKDFFKFGSPIRLWKGTGCISLQSALDRIQVELNEVARVREQLGGATPPENSLDALRVHVQREPSVRAAIDEACREWIAGRPWPQMNFDMACFVWDRLYEAGLFGAWLRTHGFHSDRTEPQILEFLLVEHWTNLGYARLKTRLAAS